MRKPSACSPSDDRARVLMPEALTDRIVERTARGHRDVAAANAAVRNLHEQLARFGVRIRDGFDADRPPGALIDRCAHELLGLVQNLTVSEAPRSLAQTRRRCVREPYRIPDHRRQIESLTNDP